MVGVILTQNFFRLRFASLFLFLMYLDCMVIGYGVDQSHTRLFVIPKYFRNQLVPTKKKMLALSRCSATTRKM